MNNQKVIPITILTGYLGAGKTTLLNRILTETHGQRIAVIENEFGKVGIDNELVIHSEDEIIEMNNGCICCTVRSDLVQILQRLQENGQKFDRVVIETTGLADPAPVAQTFFFEPSFRDRFLIDSIVTMVDARHLLQRLDDGSPEAAQQIAFADRIVLNKTDLVNAAELETVEQRIRAINVVAPIERSKQAMVPLNFVLDVNGFDIDHAAELDPAFKKIDKSESCQGYAHEDHEHHHEHNHDHGHNHHHKHHHHEHEHGITSVGFEISVPIELGLFAAWMQLLVMVKGASLYRYKGVLALEGEDQRYLFQGIHMLYEGKKDRPWKSDEHRVSRFVFIGKNLDKEVLKKGFMACVAKSEESSEVVTVDKE